MTWRLIFLGGLLGCDEPAKSDTSSDGTPIDEADLFDYTCPSYSGISAVGDERRYEIRPEEQERLGEVGEKVVTVTAMDTHGAYVEVTTETTYDITLDDGGAIDAHVTTAYRCGVEGLSLESTLLLYEGDTGDGVIESYTESRVYDPPVLLIPRELSDGDEWSTVYQSLHTLEDVETDELDRVAEYSASAADPVEIGGEALEVLRITHRTEPDAEKLVHAELGEVMTHKYVLVEHSSGR